MITEPTMVNDDAWGEDVQSAKYWKKLLTDHEKTFELYHRRVDRIEKVYADLAVLGREGADEELRLFWANIEVLKPSVYARAPEPVVDARFQERNQLKIHASEILERSLMYERDRDGMHDTLKSVRDDLLLGGRGVLWVRLAYESGQRVIKFEHIDREDFVCEPARKWKEVGWIGRKVYLTRKQIKSRWPDVDTTKITFGNSPDTDEQYTVDKKACVYEIWSKAHNAVIWYVEGPEQVLEITEPFLNLESFWPCPKPATGTMQMRSLIPTPDFLQVRGQLEQINTLTAKISSLSEALQVAGFYDAGSQDLREAIEKVMQSSEKRLQLVPVKTGAGLGASGIGQAVSFFPIEQVASTILNCIQLRQQLVTDVYEITGISDIMRGSSDAQETLGAQQLKSQYGSVRIRDKVSEMERIAADAFAIAGEIMAEHFPIEQLMQMSQYEGVKSRQQIQQEAQAIQQQAEQQIQSLISNPEVMAQAMQAPEEALKQASMLRQRASAQAQEIMQQESVEDVDQLLKSDRMRPFVLEIETESTVAPDENALKQRTTEFMQALGPMLQQLIALVSGNPEAIDLAVSILRMSLKPYRVGRSMDAAIEEFTQKMRERLENPQPDPQQQALQAEMQNKQAEIKLEVEKLKVEMQTKFEELQIKKEELKLKQIELQGKQGSEALKEQREAEKVQFDTRLVEAKIDETKAKTAQIKATPRQEQQRE